MLGHPVVGVLPPPLPLELLDSGFLELLELLAGLDELEDLGLAGHAS